MGGDRHAHKERPQHAEASQTCSELPLCLRQRATTPPGWPWPQVARQMGLGVG